MIIFRYLAKEVYSIIAACTMVLLLIFMGNQFVHYIGIAVDGKLTARLVFIVLLLKTPQLLGTLLPLSFYLAILLGYGRMYNDREMTVLFASGFSDSLLLRYTIILSTGVFIMVGALMLWLSPIVNKYADELIQRQALSPFELLSANKFQTVGKNWILYTGSISADKTKLQNVFIVDQAGKAEANQPVQQKILYAKSAQQKIDPVTHDVFMVFNDGSRYSGVAGKGNFQIVNFSQYQIRVAEGDKSFKATDDGIPTLELMNLTKGNNEFMAELQWRFSMPIMVLILMLIAVPLSQVKMRQGRYAKIGPAILIYVLYGNFMFLGRAWISDGKIPPLIGMAWVHLIMLSIAIWMHYYRNKVFAKG